MEEKIWNYIDGNCSESERQEIEQLLATDVTFKNKYTELLLLNNSLQHLEMDEPSMRFGQNIMDRINVEVPLAPLKTTVDKRIINGIGFFFISILVVMLGKLFLNLQWTSNDFSKSIFTKIDTSALFNHNFITAFLFFDFVLALWLVDYLFRRKTVQE